MRPIVFKGAMGILKSQNNMAMDCIEIGQELDAVVGTEASRDEHGVDDLPVYYDGDCVISCYMISEDEIMELVRTRKIWMCVVISNPSDHPPILLSSENPLEDDEEE